MNRNTIVPEVSAPVRSRWGILSTEMDRLLFLSMLFSCLLTAARVVHTEHRHFIFLVWNLFLAYLPYFISTQLTRMAAGRGETRQTRMEAGGRETRLTGMGVGGEETRLTRMEAGGEWTGLTRVEAGGGETRLTRIDARGMGHGLGWWALALLWLLFIPNSFYIITDLYHLGDLYNDRNMPQWFDLAMILSFVWNGLLLGVLSVRQMERLLVPKLTLIKELLFLYPVMWLNALGIYIGRYLRYNSWDIVTDPFRLLRDIAMMVVHPLQHQNTWDMVLCFSILMTLIYLLMKRISKALT